MSKHDPKAKVLVADDHEHVREALAMLLRADGYEVILCSSPQDAVSAAERDLPDIALLDMNYQRDSTSGIEGLELIERLRDGDSMLPIIALTAWGNVELAVKAMKAGANDFVEKPWNSPSLLEKVNSLAAYARGARSSRKISEFEREEAHTLQTRIVPSRHLRSGDIEIYGESSPVGAVGGDYFGVWQPTADSLHFCIADVSGKGTPGALIAAMLYASVSTLSCSGGSPDLILREVEHLLRDQLCDGRYVSIFYATLNLKSHVLEYVNAGHCPPILLRANSGPQYLEATRPVVGLVFDNSFDVHRVTLRTGDRLALYTDGITEAADSDEDEFGAQRLLQALASAGHLHPEEQHGAILQQVRDHASGGLSDDATLILVSVGLQVDTSPGASLPLADIVRF
jgi:FixJ family two-component response regulator